MKKSVICTLIICLAISLLSACGDIDDNTPATSPDVVDSDPTPMSVQTSEPTDAHRFVITSDEIGVEGHSGFAITLPEGYTLEPLIEEPGIFRGEYRVLDDLGQALMNIGQITNGMTIEEMAEHISSDSPNYEPLTDEFPFHVSVGGIAQEDGSMSKQFSCYCDNGQGGIFSIDIVLSTHDWEKHSPQLLQTLSSFEILPPVSAGEGNPQHSMEDLPGFIISAEKVYRDIVMGELFSYRYDSASGERVLNEHLEDVTSSYPNNPYGLPIFRVLPSSGFTSVAELNAAVREYWSDDFGVDEQLWKETCGYLELDNTLYFTYPATGGYGAEFLGVIWETAQFEVLVQTDEHAVVRASAYLLSYDSLYQCVLNWEIRDSKIVVRDIVWGEFVHWHDAPDIIEILITSGRLSEEQAADMLAAQES